MARRSSNESTSDLYIRLGLSLDELESGFVDAERTIRDNMARLSRSNRIIELQMQVDLSGLDEAADAEQIMQIRTEALNRQIAGQKDRVRLANAELRNMAERHGENSDQAQRARLQLEHERVALARLEEQLRHLGDAQDDANDSSNSFLDGFQRIADQCWNFIGIAQVVGDAVSSLIEHFHELQQQAYELNMPFQRTKELLRQIKLAGGDIGDFEGFIRGITDAYVKGEWDDPEFLALSKYGAKITDATGKLKDFKDITEEVYQAYLKAKEEGNEIEFLQLVGGESGVRDAIQMFERYGEAKEDASKIFDSGIDPDEMHKADRALKLLTEQMDEFKDALINIAAPAATAAMKELFEVFHTGTEIASKSTDVIREFFDTLHTGFVMKGDFPVFDKIGALINSVERYFEIWEKFEKPTREKDTFWITDAFEKLRELHFTSNGIDPENVDMSKRWAWGKYREEINETKDAIDEASKSMDNAAVSWAQFQQKMHGDSTDEPLSQYAQIRIKEFKDELEDLRNELDNWDNDYLKSMGELELWRNRELDDKLHVSKDERIAIEKLYAAKRKAIDKQLADDLDDIRKEVTAAELSTLEQKTAKIDQEAEKWIKKGMDEAEAETLATRLKNVEIEDLNKKFEQEKEAIGKKGLEKTLARIEKEKQAWIDKGIEEARATELADAQKAVAIQKHNDDFTKKREAIQNKLDAVYEKQEKAQEEYQKKLKKAQEEYRKQIEQRRQLAEELTAKLAALRHDELTNALANIEKEKQAYIQKGIDEVSAAEWAAQAKANVQRNAAMKVLKQQLEEFQIYLKQGYYGLQKNYMNKLVNETGKSKQWLQSITPEQIRGFMQASDIAQRSLLPNLLTSWERQAVSRGKYPDNSQMNFVLPEEPKKPDPPKDYSDEINKLKAELAKLLKEYADQIAKVQDELNQLNIPTDNLNQQLQGITMPTDNLNQQLQNIEMPVDKLNQQLQQLTISTLPPVYYNTTNNITIEEAHAWDYDHILELADMVADIIIKELKHLGGDNNAY